MLLATHPDQGQQRALETLQVLVRYLAAIALADAMHAGGPAMWHATHAFYADLYDEETVRLALERAQVALEGEATTGAVVTLQ